jgi:hypothetical protein
MAGKLTWWEAAEITGVTDRTMRRWRQNYEEFGHDGLFGNAASAVQSEFLWRPSSYCLEPQSNIFHNWSLAVNKYHGEKMTRIVRTSKALKESRMASFSADSERQASSTPEHSSADEIFA